MLGSSPAFRHDFFMILHGFCRGAHQTPWKHQANLIHNWSLFYRDNPKKLGNTLKRMRLSSRVHLHKRKWLMLIVCYIEVPFHTYIGPYWLSILWDQRVLGGDSRKIDWMAWSTSARVNPRSHQCMQVDKTQRPMHNATFPEKGHVFKILYRRYVNR